MAANKKNNGEASVNNKIGIGIGLTAAAVAAAGTYFLYGSKNAAKNRKTVKSWMLKAKAEVLETLEDAKQMSREEFESLVEEVAHAYSMAKNASKADLKDFKQEMKDHWTKLEKEWAPKKATKKAAPKKATKKAVPKKAPVKKTAPKKNVKKA